MDQRFFVVRRKMPKLAYLRASQLEVVGWTNFRIFEFSKITNNENQKVFLKNHSHLSLQLVLLIIVLVS
jgi:hypothetical protein